MPKAAKSDSSGVWSNPYLYSATILARLAVLSATVLWGVIVILAPTLLNPLRHPMYTDMLEIMPARGWAAIGIAGCLFGFVRLCRHYPPHWVGPILYATIMFFWTYLAISLFLTQHNITPAGASCITVIAALSVFAFVSNPKKGWR